MNDHEAPWFDGEVPLGEVGISRAQWIELITRSECNGEGR